MGYGKRQFSDDTEETIAEVITRFGKVRAPWHLKLACRRLGLGPEWVLGWIKHLMESPAVEVKVKVGLLELANWWLMVSTGLYPDKNRVASRMQRRRAGEFQSVRPYATSRAKVVKPMPTTENKGRTPGVSPFPGGVVPDEPKDRRDKRRSKHVQEKLGRGFLDKVSEADGGG